MLKGFTVPSDKLIQCNAPFVGISITSLASDHCVYEVWKGETLIYIGCCYLRQLFSMPDAKIIARFNKLIDIDDTISIAVKYIGDRIQCYNRRGLMLRQIMPECNKYMMIRAKMVIMCNEDGKKFRTQAEACHAYNIRQSNLSSHLSGRGGFRTLNGRTFSRVTEDDNREDS